MNEIIKQYKPIPRFVPDTCKNCKGHSNYLLDCDYTRQEDIDLLIKILDREIK